MSTPRDAISLCVFIGGAGKTAGRVIFGATDEGALKVRCAGSAISRRPVSYAGYQVQRYHPASTARGACLFLPEESGGPRHCLHGPRAVGLRRGRYIARPQKPSELYERIRLSPSVNAANLK